MRRQHVWSIIILMLGIFIVLIPWVIFPVCGIGRYTPLPGTPVRLHHGCDVTRDAATLLGILVCASGVLPLIVKQRWAIIIALAGTALMGILLILFPTVLTGVCKVATMPCVYGTKPALIIAGIISILTGGCGLLAVIKKT